MIAEGVKVRGTSDAPIVVKNTHVTEDLIEEQRHEGTICRSRMRAIFQDRWTRDVVGALPKELVKRGRNSRGSAILTKMSADYQEQLEDCFSFEVNVGWRKQYCGLKKLVLNRVTYYFIDNLYYFGRDNLYDYYDDGERFAFFN